MQAAEGHKKQKKELNDMQQEAAKQGLTFKFDESPAKGDGNTSAKKKPRPAASLASALGDMGRQTPARPPSRCEGETMMTSSSS